jgi:hypothetical protein
MNHGKKDPGIVIVQTMQATAENLVMTAKAAEGEMMLEVEIQSVTEEVMLDVVVTEIAVQRVKLLNGMIVITRVNLRTTSAVAQIKSPDDLDLLQTVKALLRKKSIQKNRHRSSQNVEIPEGRVGGTANFAMRK